MGRHKDRTWTPEKHPYPGPISDLSDCSANCRRRSTSESLVPERDDRIEARRPSCRPHPEQHADHRGKHERHHDRRRRDLRVPLRELAHRQRAATAYRGTDQSTKKTKHNGLDEEPQQDVCARGAERLAAAARGGPPSRRLLLRAPRGWRSTGSSPAKSALHAPTRKRECHLWHTDFMRLRSASRRMSSSFRLASRRVRCSAVRMAFICDLRAALMESYAGWSGE